jgi:TolA-binding protein
MAAIAVLLAGTACQQHDGVRARYELERMLWRAQYHQRRINIAFMHAARGDTRMAIEAYRAVVARDPLAAPGAATWDPAVTADIRRVQMSARIALAHLYFLGERYADAGTMYEETIRLGSMTLRDELDARLGVARSLYMTGESDAVLEQCALVFRDVSQNPDFWSGRFDVDDVLLNIPVVLARLSRDAGDEARHAEYASLADDFYGRVIATWPGTRADDQARLARVQLQIVRGDWQRCVELLDEIVARPGQQAGDPAALRLVAGEIRAFRMGDDAGGRAAFEDVLARYPGTEAAYAARYDLASLRLAAGDAAGALQAFRELEREQGVPGAVAARAMFARASALEAQGNWDEALALLRRLEQLYPYTAPALQAPLVVVRRYVREGERTLAQLALEHARAYYLSLLDRRSRFAGDRLAVQGALAEVYTAAGLPADGAAVLAGGVGEWDDHSAAAGLLRSAELYEAVLGDRDQAAATLKKVIERFPETRYASVAQRRLDGLGDRP